jgi:hypothetical protein
MESAAVVSEADPDLFTHVAKVAAGKGMNFANFPQVLDGSR